MKIQWVNKVQEGIPSWTCAWDGHWQPEDIRKLGRKRSGKLQILLNGESGSMEDLRLEAREIVRELYRGAYEFSKKALKEWKQESVWEMRRRLADFGDGEFFLVSDTDLTEAVEQGTLEGRCAGYARALGDLPNNYLHAEEMAGYAAALAEDLGCTIQLLKDDELKSLGCGGILAVNQGSSRPAVLAALRYEGAPASPLTALVGKGVMFDAGGYHLKDIDGMKGMKLDMCGAADVLETFEILARRKVKKNLLAILVLVENVISPDACKMGDVITMMGGQTVEIYNTDAEGRLILADGLEYAQRQGARQVIDVATLTYGCQAALGDEVTGVFCNSDTLFSAWQQAAGTAREKIWRLPLMEVYHRNLEWSVCADFANYAPGKGAAASTAACFLEKFIHPETEWLHLDMVGTATNRGEQKGMAMGASGAMIGSLIRFLED